MNLSAYWSGMSERHRAQLEESGFENFKRTVNADYFDWRYPVLSRPHMIFWSHVTALWNLTTAKEKLRAIGNCGFYGFMVRLLWQYSVRQDKIGVTKLEEPTIGNPFPIYFDGKLISQDLANTSLELNFMLAHSPEPTNVLEIGAGYGRTAWAILSLFPKCGYRIVDIEPASVLSSRYVYEALGKDRIGTYHPHDLNAVIGGETVLGGDPPFSHAISISTFPEFTWQQVEYYRKQMDRLASHVYLKQHAHWYNPEDINNIYFEDMPTDHWTHIAKRTCPTHPRFTEAVWRVR